MTGECVMGVILRTQPRGGARILGGPRSEPLCGHPCGQGRGGRPLIVCNLLQTLVGAGRF